MLQGWYTIHWEAFVAGASSRELLGVCSVARAPKPFSALAPSETGARTGVGGACRSFATTFSATTVGVTGTGGVLGVSHLPLHIFAVPLQASCAFVSGLS